MINEIFSNAKERMNKAIEHCSKEMSQVRTGRASTSLLDNVKVDYYGSLSPLNNIAHISTPDAQLIVIQPFDPTSLELIEKTIISSDLGLNPNNDGNVIRLNIPALTEERRKELIKVVHGYAENGKVSIRNIRRDINDQLKKEKENNLSEDNYKRALDNIQELTDNSVVTIDELLKNKEKDILT